MRQVSVSGPESLVALEIVTTRQWSAVVALFALCASSAPEFDEAGISHELPETFGPSRLTQHVVPYQKVIAPAVCKESIAQQRNSEVCVVIRGSPI